MIGVSNSSIANTLFVSNTAGYAGSAICSWYSGPFNITNNPMFALPAALDYQLLAASECINSGATLISVTNDCIGEPRPYGGGWDIGAYEYIPEPFLIVNFYLLFIIYYRKIRKN